MSYPTSVKHMFHRIQLIEGKFCEIGHFEYGRRGGGVNIFSPMSLQIDDNTKEDNFSSYYNR